MVRARALLGVVGERRAPWTGAVDGRPMTEGAQCPPGGAPNGGCEIPIPAVPLARLMGDLRAVDVASLSGVSQSTLSRLWSNPRWIERVEGATLSKLMAVAPPIARYARRWGEYQRLDAASQSAHEAGVTLHADAFAGLVRAAPAPTVIALLSAVTEMRLGQFDNASRLFSAGWGQRCNGVADTLLDDASAGIFVDHDAVLRSAEEFVSNPPGFGDITQIVGYGIVEHKLIKAGIVQPPVRSAPQSLAFLTRSAAIARLLSEDDLGFAEWYRDRVFAEHELASMELWSHATYSGDIPLGQRRLPRGGALSSTTAMTVTDLGSRNHAYVYYLLLVVVPLLAKMDPCLAQRCPPVVSALAMLADECGDRRVAEAARNAHVQLCPPQ